MENGRCSESNFTTDRRYPSLALLRESLAFSADFVDELGVCGKLLPQGDRPWPGVRLRVVHGHLDFEVTEVGPPDSLAHLGGFGDHAAVPVDPQVVAESDGVDHQRLAGPRRRRV